MILSALKALLRKPKAKSRPRRASSGDASRQLEQLWKKLCAEYFPELEHLLDYRVRWSRRNQRRTLASCNVRRRSVTVARELNHSDCDRWLEPILYHELCHAALGESLKRKGFKTPWHGREFKRLEARHPLTSELNAWIKSGGWSRAVRSQRTRNYWQKLKAKE